MHSLRELISKKTVGWKFGSSGRAHRLSESSMPSTSSIPPTSSVPSQREEFSEQASRSEEAKLAAIAALKRIEQRKPNELNWSSRAIKSKAKIELEFENSAKKLAVEPKQIPTFQAECVDFTVSGVYFRCPMIGPYVYPKAEIENRIKSFLYKQLEEESEIRGLTACLIIHTLNKNKDKVQEGVKTLVRYLENIINEPTVEKYRKIKLKNKAFQERIADLEGAFDFLLAAGFSLQTLNMEKEEEYFILKNENFNLENLQMLKEKILSTKPILPVLDRNLKVLKPTDFSERVNLPQDFFKLSVDEIKREQKTRIKTAEQMTQLRTKAMRERDEIKEQHVYNYSLIRIRFPDGIILQGTFSVHEKLQAVKEFASENLADSSKEFDLLLPGGIKLNNESSLLELKLVPAAILNFKVSNLTGETLLNCKCMSILSNL